MWDAVRGLRDEGITVVLTTHYMEEADELCDRLAIIDHGKILVEDTPAALKASIGAQKIYELELRACDDLGPLADSLKMLAGGDRSGDAGDGGAGVCAWRGWSAVRYCRHGEPVSACAT